MDSEYVLIEYKPTSIKYAKLVFDCGTTIKLTDVFIYKNKITGISLDGKYLFECEINEKEVFL